MAVLAVIYGICERPWDVVPITFCPVDFSRPEHHEQIAIFHWDALIIATIIHLLCSVLVAFSMASCFRCFRATRFCWRGNRTYLWSGLLHSMLEAIDPVLTSG